MIYYGNEFYHHGILGQKWGKRHGPPYPLDPRKRTNAYKEKHYDSAKTPSSGSNKPKVKYSLKNGRINIERTGGGSSGSNKPKDNKTGSPKSLGKNIKTAVKNKAREVITRGGPSRDGINDRTEPKKPDRKQEESIINRFKFGGPITDGGIANLNGNKSDRSQNKDNQSIIDTIENKIKNLTPEQKEKIKKVAIIGAAVAGTALVAYGAYRLSNNVQVQNSILRAKSALSRGTRTRLNTNGNIINPMHSEKNSGSCAVAEELRLRGHDVFARSDGGTMTSDDLRKVFGGFHENSVKSVYSGTMRDSGWSLTDSPKEIRKQISKNLLKDYPDGARGVLHIPFVDENQIPSIEQELFRETGEKVNLKVSDGMNISWERVGNRIIFKDPSNMKNSKFGSDLAYMFFNPGGGDITSTRLDDLNIKVDAIQNVVDANSASTFNQISADQLSDLAKKVQNLRR